MSSYAVPARKTQAEIRVSNSRFIAHLAPAADVDAAKTFIDDIRSQYADATHNVPAYVIGHGASVTAHCNDDGEPSGTAGRPVLAVLQGSGLGDLVVVVTRYFGGTKLGTGGLVRAYTQAAQAVLAVTPTARRAPVHHVRIEMPYPLYEQARNLIGQLGGELVQEDFAGQVTVEARLLSKRFDELQEGLTELSRGRVAVEVLGVDESAIWPGA
ncbi:MAG: YigZ family protein [Anaerolineales bacterium]|jgi:uncharacterized YigZ family protein